MIENIEKTDNLRYNKPKVRKQSAKGGRFRYGDEKII